MRSLGKEVSLQQATSIIAQTDTSGRAHLDFPDFVDAVAAGLSPFQPSFGALQPPGMPLILTDQAREHAARRRHERQLLQAELEGRRHDRMRIEEELRDLERERQELREGTRSELHHTHMRMQPSSNFWYASLGTRIHMRVHLTYT